MGGGVRSREATRGRVRSSRPSAAVRPAGSAPRRRQPGLRPAATAPSGLTVALAVVVGAWMTVDVLLDGPLRHLDHRVSDLALDTGIRAADRPQRMFAVKLGVYALTQLGARTPMVLLSCVAVAGLAWRRRTVRPVVLLAVALALVGVAVTVAKRAVGRSMPATDVLHGTAGQTFPSGHVPTAVVLWGLLAWLAAEYQLPRRLTRPLGVLRWLAPALVFVAMVLLDYHWLTDVVAGLALGIVLLRVVPEVDRWALRDWRRGEHRRTGAPAGDRADHPAADRSADRAAGFVDVADAIASGPAAPGPAGDRSGPPRGGAAGGVRLDRGRFPAAG